MTTTNDRINSILRTLHDLKPELEAIQFDYEAVMAGHSKLLKVNSEQFNDNEHLRERIATLEACNEHQASFLLAYQSQEADLRHELDNKDEVIKDLVAKLDRANISCREADEAQLKLMEEVEAKDRELEGMRDRGNDADEAFTTALARWDTEREEMQLEINRLKAKHGNILHALTSIHSSLARFLPPEPSELRHPFSEPYSDAA